MEEIITKILNGESLTIKEKQQIPVQIPSEQESQKRICNMKEVTGTYTNEQAIIEASRCLECKNPLCMGGCPVNVKIPTFLKEVAKGNFKEAYEVLKEDTLLPSICGRVCPQEKQCQKECVLGKSLKDVNKAVSIGRVERFVADYARENNFDADIKEIKSNGKKVAVIGSGPCGITASADLRRLGFDVTVFEAFHKFGGVLIYGIPEFRLPNDIVEKEIEKLKKMGVKFVPNFVIGRSATLKQLKEEYGFDAIFISTGAGLPIFMNIEGENLVGVFSANEFLTRVNLMQGFKEEACTPLYKAKNVVVVGGGNVAMDASRVARRLGANVKLVYRRTREEMPARKEEVEHAMQEGVEFLFLTNPKRILGDESKKVTQIECLKYELGEVDASGRRSPVEIKGSEFLIEADMVIMALGNNPNPLISKTTPEIEVDKKGRIVVNENLKTSLDGVYAGGDIVLGAATVILAMGMGRKAAKSIGEYLES